MLQRPKRNHPLHCAQSSLLVLYTSFFFIIIINVHFCPCLFICRLKLTCLDIYMGSSAGVQSLTYFTTKSLMVASGSLGEGQGLGHALAIFLFNLFDQLILFTQSLLNRELMKFSFCFSSLLKPVQISPNATNTKMINIIYPTKTIIMILSN